MILIATFEIGIVLITHCTPRLWFVVCVIRSILASNDYQRVRNLLNIVKHISSLPDVSGDDCHNINESRKCVNATIVSTVAKYPVSITKGDE